MKTYTGGQGYVYQYYFVGKRQASSTTKPSTEYIFDVTSDRKTMFAVSVFLPDETLKTWAAAHGRALTDAEGRLTITTGGCWLPRTRRISGIDRANRGHGAATLIRKHGWHILGRVRGQR